MKARLGGAPASVLAWVLSPTRGGSCALEASALGRFARGREVAGGQDAGDPDAEGDPQLALVSGSHEPHDQAPDELVDRTHGCPPSTRSASEPSSRPAASLAARERIR